MLCFSGAREGDDGSLFGLDKDSLVGEVEGVVARIVEGDLETGESGPGRRNGEARGELKDIGLLGDCD